MNKRSGWLGGSNSIQRFLNTFMGYKKIVTLSLLTIGAFPLQSQLSAQPESRTWRRLTTWPKVEPEASDAPFGTTLQGALLGVALPTQGIKETFLGDVKAWLPFNKNSLNGTFYAEVQGLGSFREKSDSWSIGGGYLWASSPLFALKAGGALNFSLFNWGACAGTGTCEISGDRWRMGFLARGPMRDSTKQLTGYSTLFRYYLKGTLPGWERLWGIIGCDVPRGEEVRIASSNGIVEVPNPIGGYLGLEYAFTKANKCFFHFQFPQLNLAGERLQNWNVRIGIKRTAQVRSQGNRLQLRAPKLGTRNDLLRNPTDGFDHGQFLQHIATKKAFSDSLAHKYEKGEIAIDRIVVPKNRNPQIKISATSDQTMNGWLDELKSAFVDNRFPFVKRLTWSIHFPFLQLQASLAAYDLSDKWGNCRFSKPGSALPSDRVEINPEKSYKLQMQGPSFGWVQPEKSDDTEALPESCSPPIAFSGLTEEECNELLMNYRTELTEIDGDRSLLFIEAVKTCMIKIVPKHNNQASQLDIASEQILFALSTVTELSEEESLVIYDEDSQYLCTLDVYNPCLLSHLQRSEEGFSRKLKFRYQNGALTEAFIPPIKAFLAFNAHTYPQGPHIGESSLIFEDTTNLFSRCLFSMTSQFINHKATRSQRINLLKVYTELGADQDHHLCIPHNSHILFSSPSNAAASFNGIFRYVETHEEILTGQLNLEEGGSAICYRPFCDKEGVLLDATTPLCWFYAETHNPHVKSMPTLEWLNALKPAYIPFTKDAARPELLTADADKLQGIFELVRSTVAQKGFVPVVISLDLMVRMGKTLGIALKNAHPDSSDWITWVLNGESNALLADPSKLGSIVAVDLFTGECLTVQELNSEAQLDTPDNLKGIQGMVCFQLKPIRDPTMLAEVDEDNL